MGVLPGSGLMANKSESGASLKDDADIAQQESLARATIYWLQ